MHQRTEITEWFNKPCQMATRKTIYLRLNDKNNYITTRFAVTMVYFSNHNSIQLSSTDGISWPDVARQIVVPVKETKRPCPFHHYTKAYSGKWYKSFYIILILQWYNVYIYLIYFMSVCSVSFVFLFFRTFYRFILFYVIWFILLIGILCAVW